MQYSVGRIHSVGQVFISKELLQMELTNYAIARGFNCKYLKNDSVRLTVRCNVSVCPWRLHASVVRGGPQFAIKSLNNIHTCGCDIMSDGHPQTSKKWVANAVKGKLVDKPTYRASEMMSDIRREYGICIPYHQAWWGKEVAVSSLYGDFRTSYHMLNWYSERALQSNPGSILSLELVVDLCSFWTELISNSRVQGVILAASALNGNNELFTVAYSIADLETYDNWVWFLQNLKKALLSDRRIAFLSDRGRGLKEAIPDIFPNDHHGYCFQHIMQNFNDQCAGKYAAPFKKLLRKILQRIAYAVTEQEYEDTMMAMELNSADAKEWVLQNDVEHWSHARFPGQRFGSLNTQAICSITFCHLWAYSYRDNLLQNVLNKVTVCSGHLLQIFDVNLISFTLPYRFGELYSNLAESFNNWIHDARSLPILQMVDKIRVQMMEMAAKRKIDAALWDTPYCPKVQKIIEKNLQERRSLAIRHSDGIKFEVVESMKTYVVDLHLQTCSCGHWQLVKIPCKHACAAIGSNKEAVTQYVSAFYSTEVYRAAYETNIQPIPTFDMPDPPQPSEVLIKPPTTKRLPGRPRKRRIHSRGEVDHAYICSRCKQTGHNRRTCSNPPHNPDGF
ncbi:hypothetical protein Taro_001139 [Colocasia esculenta]|uniref:SWIM-type domain-containing protein n=1 Tax=Colocasia esculenta TaxID=4460 RepID=A0A843TJS1_COLES|nr:hypothetical protein [Colocasia esculenta]